MDIIILTGMSGAGKSLAANYLEDMGFFCVDNLPPQLMPDLIRAYTHNHTDLPDIVEDVSRLAFVIDVRSSDLFEGLSPALEKMNQMGIAFRMIYLEATDQSLINRYKQSRRNHPLAQKLGLSQAIALERKRLAPIKELASDVIDTSNLAPPEFRNMLYAMLSSTERDERMTILVQSFGFKYGIPVDCDNVFDVRFIPNPFYIPDLKILSGLDKPVCDYIYQFSETTVFLDKTEQLLEYAIPFYIREGKVRMTIGVGCTGGRHRSVALAEDLGNRLRDNHLRVVVDHRDLGKDPQHHHKNEQDR